MEGPDPMTPTAIDLEGLRALVLGRLQRDGSITREDIDEIFSGAVSEQDARIARATEGVVLTARLAAADPQLRNRLPRSVRSAVDNLDRALSAPPAAPAGDREAVAGEIVEALFKDIRGRKVLKWFFDPNPDRCASICEHFDPIDLDVQGDISAAWRQIVLAALSRARTGSETQ